MKIPTDLASSSHSLDGGKVDHPCYPTLFLCYLFAFNKIRPLPSYLSKMKLLSIECSLMGGRIGLIFVAVPMYRLHLRVSQLLSRS